MFIIHKIFMITLGISLSHSYKRLNNILYSNKFVPMIQSKVCFNFQKGQCQRGGNCRFAHTIRSNENEKSTPILADFENDIKVKYHYFSI